MKQQKQPIIIKQQSGQLASTTGNITGIYDLSGGAWEQVAGYITNGNESLLNGTTASGIPPLVAKTTSDATAYQTLSTKYATVYPYDSSDETRPNNYIIYKNANYGYGDAILEISSTGDNATGWFGDYSYFVEVNFPFFVRGAGYSYGGRDGAFAFSRSDGDGTFNKSFRVVLIAM